VVPGGEFCALLRLENPVAVQGLEATLTDVPDEFDLVGCDCTDRTVGFVCGCNQPASDRVRVALADLGGACVPAGGL
jgi:hypothetical protein